MNTNHALRSRRRPALRLAADPLQVHSSRRATSALLSAALLGGLFALSGGGCATPTEDETASLESAIRDDLANPQDTSLHLPYLRNRCPQGQVKFDGLCRRGEFFERFVSTGASLIGVSGPPASDSEDTGVVVLEAISEHSYKQLYILPDHSPLGGPPRFRSYEYRADYPMIFQEAVLTFQDDGGYLHVFSESRGPGTAGLTTLSWSHYAKTAAGYIIHNSDGTGVEAIANGGSGTYCDVAASGAGWAASTVCGAAALYTGAASGLVVAILTGAASFVSLGGGFGVGAPEAALASLGAGVTVGATWFAGYVGTAAAVVCGPLGDLVTEAVGTFVCDDQPGPEDIEFLPVISSVPIFPSEWGICPSGTVLYTGEVTQCTSSNRIVDDIETIDVLCIRNYVYQQCAYV